MTTTTSKGDKIEENKVKNDRYMKELELIQRCIDRMANNSFKIKRWLAAILVLTLGIITRLDGNRGLIAGPLIIIVIIMLAIMDSYYLALARLYRKRFNHVVEAGWTLEGRYSNQSNGHPFELNPQKISESGAILVDNNYSNVIKQQMLLAFKSKVIWPVYSVSIAIVIMISLCVWLI
jgi:hypothetical protein